MPSPIVPGSEFNPKPALPGPLPNAAPHPASAFRIATSSSSLSSLRPCTDASSILNGPGGSTPPPATARPRPTTLLLLISYSCSRTPPRHVFRNLPMGRTTSAHVSRGANRKHCQRSSFPPVTQLSVRMDATYFLPSDLTLYRSAVKASRSMNSPAGRSLVLHPAKPLRLRDFVTLGASDSPPEDRDDDDEGSTSAPRSIALVTVAPDHGSICGFAPGAGSSAGRGRAISVLSVPSSTIAPTSPSSAPSGRGRHDTDAALIPPCDASDHARHFDSTSPASLKDTKTSRDAGATSWTSFSHRRARRARLPARAMSRRRGAARRASVAAPGSLSTRCMKSSRRLSEPGT